MCFSEGGHRRNYPEQIERIKGLKRIIRQRNLERKRNFVVVQRLVVRL